MRKLFGTDGIRGQANKYPLDGSTVFKIGAAIASHFAEKKRVPRLVIGRDTRRSGRMIQGALVSGICSVGGEALLANVITTPAIAYLTQVVEADAGIVISASHNPYVDNGIKIFGRDGFKLPDEEEEQIEELILHADMDELAVPPHAVGDAGIFDGAVDRYIHSLLATAPRGISFSGKKVVLDCANGAAFEVAPRVFRRLQANVVAIHNEPNGRNINKACGSLHPEELGVAVRENGADIGIAFDGDADRAIFVDENGQIVDGDQIMAICATRMMKQGRLPGNTFVATVMSNMGLFKACEAQGVKVLKTKVGDRYVMEEMRKHGHTFGGEQSGHLIFSDFSTTGDGVLAAIQVLSIMVDENKRLSELAKIMERYPQVLKNLNVVYKTPMEELEKAPEIIKQVESELGDEGRVLVRYSGTENKIRVMVEGKNAEEIDAYADRIIKVLDAELN